MSNRSEFVDCTTPFMERMKLYDRSKPPSDQPKNDATEPARAIPEGFIDAMKVRFEVFVEEQGVPALNEVDDNDHRSFHWTAYASVPAKSTSPDLAPQDEKIDNKKRRKSASTKLPIGTIRLVPPPHPPHPNGSFETDVHKTTEAYVQLGRLAVIKEFRKAGIAKLLIETALAYVRAHPSEILPFRDAGDMEVMRWKGKNVEFNGLVLVHAQTGVQKVWRKYGFETDESMGHWDEEGIDHVGMWKRVDVKEGMRSAKIWVTAANPEPHR